MTVVTQHRRDFKMPPLDIDRIREELDKELIPRFMDVLYQHDKGSRTAKVSELRSEAARNVYKAVALRVFSAEEMAERIFDVHLADAEHFAHQANENESVNAQARRDVDRYGEGSINALFATTKPGQCPVCKEDVVTNAVSVLLRDDIGFAAHGLCLATRPERFTRVADNLYNVRVVPHGRR